MTNMKALHRNSVHEINAQLGRVPKTEAPINKHERQERRNRRQEDFKRQKSERSQRLGEIQDQWQSHRSDYVWEDEVEVSSVDGKNIWNCWNCCGFTLCCAW